MDWATLLNETRRRAPNKQGADPRLEFDRDYDRALFSAPVRRLQDKAQVFPLEPNDSVRTRLTHSLEVSNVAKSIARRACAEVREMSELGDQECRSIEGIAATTGLLHDLGNPPFGHAGEVAIQEWFESKQELFADINGHDHAQQMICDFKRFEGNAHTMRLACRLQVLVDDNGLNFTFGTLSALRKYVGASNRTSKAQKHLKKPGFFFSENDRIAEIEQKCGTERFRNPITYLVEAADDIVYSTVDLEDGMTKGAFRDWKELLELLNAKCTSVDAKDVVAEAKSRIESTLKDSIYTLSPEQCNMTATQLMRTIFISHGIGSLVGAFCSNYNAIMAGSFESDLAHACNLRDLIDGCKKVGQDRVYCMKSTVKLEVMGRQVITGLLDTFVEPVLAANNADGPKTPFERRLWQLMSKNYKSVFDKAVKDAGGNVAEQRYAQLQLLTDYVCGMTDGFACRLSKELGLG